MFMSHLMQRSLTAMVLVSIVVLTVCYVPSHYFVFVLCFILAVASGEWSRLAGMHDKRGQLFYIFILQGLFFLVQHYGLHYLVLVTGGAIWCFALSALIYYQRTRRWFDPKDQRHRLLLLAIGALILLPFIVACALLQAQATLFYLFFIIFIIAMSDSCAYFVGRALGKRPLAHLISPNKTIEGAMGGLLITVLAAIVILLLSVKPLLLSWSGLALVIVVIIFGIVGDLFESLQKRVIGVKDSGQLLPGHGGLLDRLDAMMAAFPLFTLGLYIISPHLFA